MSSTSAIGWNPKLIDLSNQRTDKPRISGCTMVMDKGLGLTNFRDTLELAGEYIDFIKLGFGTAGLTPETVLKQKIALAKKHQVHLYPGGTFFEVALAQSCLDIYFHTLRELEFEWIEISDGTVDLSPATRIEAIKKAREWGFRVITEIGKKEEGSVTSIPQLLSTYEQDLSAGAFYVIVEGRETGENIGIFNQYGEVNQSYVTQVMKTVGPERIIWEAPQKQQQVWILGILGAQANLGNISPQEILSVESLRRGLRSDTFYCWKEKKSF
ncbi:phosphosulfolactate synthase [Paenactinomyces guangxiensis]|uniref:Phosphosulfolactate synthase n=1 Tax=Paenactinomyces guangxiensis TaxID=1490290 RepID=A0A7W1WS46_9BACL|nr:phosphosulfolactate synthase [Paenactinomyces guangxiensis]MBA4494977.1 phosphosulfolactate synthase [Paenactinomyces guangxiensis]MBH8592060.1 phosphosulfolactate synthase [Paenactinomyces guangxiensis]